METPRSKAASSESSPPRWSPNSGQWFRGLSPDALQRFIEDRTALRGVLERAFASVATVVATVVYPFVHKFLGWNDQCKVIREGTRSPTPLDITKLELVPFHKKGEDLVGGKEMLRRARDKNAYPGYQGWGTHQGDELYARRSEIPEEMRQFVLLLPDTEFHNENGSRFIAYLFWSGGEWQFD